MAEEREALGLPLLRAPLVDPRTGVVTWDWQPWFEAVFRTQNATGVGLGSVSDQLVATQERLSDAEVALSDPIPTPLIEALINRALDERQRAELEPLLTGGASDMAVVNKVLVDAVATATLDSLYTAEALVTARVHAATITNPTGSAISVTMALIARSGASAITVVSAKSVAPAETLVATELLNQTIEPGGSIQVQGASLEVYISGLEFT